MKSHKYVSAAICISFFMALLLFGIVENVRGELKERDITIRAESGGKTLISNEFSEKAEYKRKAKERFDKLSKEINDLEAKTEKAGSKTKADFKKNMKELSEKRAALQINMEKLDVLNKDEWETAKQKVESEMDELEKAYRKARSHFE